jgi:hypothetical protein
MIRSLLASVFAVLVTGGLAFAAEPVKCDGHGVSVNYEIAAGEDSPIQVQVTADSQTVEAGSPLDLGYRAVGAEIKLHVGAYDEDVHVCQIPMAPVKNYIQATEIKVDVLIEGTDSQPDKKIASVTLTTPPADPPQTDRGWDGTWKIPATAIPEGETQPVSLVGKRLVFKFVGIVDDVTCSAPKHANSDDEAVDFAYRNYTAELTVSTGLLLTVRPRGAPAGYQGIGIAAGGINSAAHQADVEIRVLGGGQRNVNLSLAGGQGEGTTYTFTIPIIDRTVTVRFGSGQVRARLQVGGRTIIAGQGAQTVVVRTGPDGIARGTLTSSNKLELCTISASVQLPGQGVVQDSKVVPFEFGALGIEFEKPYLPPAGKERIDITLTHHGQPMNNHDLVVYAEKVVVEGQVIAFDENDPEKLADYILVSNRQNFSRTRWWTLDPRVKTDGQGKANVWAENVSAGRVESWTVAVSDFSLKK